MKVHWSPEEVAAFDLWVARHGGGRQSFRNFLEAHPWITRSLAACRRRFDGYYQPKKVVLEPVKPFKCKGLRLPDFLSEEQQIQAALLAQSSLGAAAQYCALQKLWRVDPPLPARVGLPVRSGSRRESALKARERYENDPEYRAKRQARSLDYYRRRREAAS